MFGGGSFRRAIGAFAWRTDQPWRLWEAGSVGQADGPGGYGSEPGGPVLTKAAQAQIAQLSPDELEQMEMVLAALKGPEEVQRYGWPVSDSPAGQVWRIRAGRVGLFVAIDQDSVLVVGLAVRRGQAGDFYGTW